MSSTLLLSRELQSAISDLLAHPLYHQVNTVPRLRLFMREHAFAVWDFMPLLKRLQQEFCGTTQPWMPPPHPQLARFVNEIVLGEESDTDSRGGFASHFELYLRAMDEVQAESAPIHRFLENMRQGQTAKSILADLPIRPQTREFVDFNLSMARNGSSWEVAAVFCFGREDVIPEMFSRLLKPLQEARLPSREFEYYLQRHIELDGDQHGPLSQRMLATLIADSPQRVEAALAAARRAIKLRIGLWDGILEAIKAAS